MSIIDIIKSWQASAIDYNIINLKSEINSLEKENIEFEKDIEDIIKHPSDDESDDRMMIDIYEDNILYNKEEIFKIKDRIAKLYAKKHKE